MKFKINHLVVVGALLTPFFKLVAQSTEQNHANHSHARHGLHVAVAPEDTSQAMSKEDLGRLMDQAHEALERGEKHEEHDHHHEHCPNCGGDHRHHAHEEHGHKHGFSWEALFSKEEWAEKLNFKQKMLNAIRWYQITATNDEIKGHAANIATMLVASHYSEGLIGLEIGRASLAVDNLFVNVAGVITGGAIVIPGLDPLCIFLVWTYKKIPHLMGKMMYVPRVIIVSGAEFLYKALGADYVMKTLFYKQDAFERLESLLAKKEGGSEVFRVDDNVEFSVKYRGKEILLLNGIKDGQRISWEQMLVSKDLQDPEVLKYLKKQIKPLNWILRQSIYDVIKRLESAKGIARLSYIETATESGDVVDVRMKTRGMASVPPTRFIGAKNCLFKLFMAMP